MNIVTNYFGRQAKQVAKETQFVQRKSKLTGSAFLQIMVFGLLIKPKASLNQLCEVAVELGISIKKQGLHERMNEAAATFMKEMWQQTLAKLVQQQVGQGWLQQFCNVYLLDSTCLNLPSVLADDFPGCGGKGAKASLKLHALWDCLSGKLIALWEVAGKAADQGFKQHLAYIEANTLFLADLGYFVLAHFRTIEQSDAYYVSRFNHQVIVHHPVTMERLDLLAELDKNPQRVVQQQVTLGTVDQLTCRLVALPLPADMVAQRRRKAKQKAKRKGRTASKQTLRWLAWSIYITNLPAARLTPQQLATLYRLRWQIELTFKLWKSGGQLEHIITCNRHRVLVELYARLIGFALLTFLLHPLRSLHFELSHYKAYAILQRHASALLKALFCFKFVTVIQTLWQRWSCFAVKEHCPSRLTTAQRIETAMATPASGPLLLPATVSPAAPSSLAPHNSCSAFLFWQMLLMHWTENLQLNYA